MTSPVLLNDFARQWRDTSEHVLEAVRAVGESAYYILGKRVAAFEAELAGYLGIEHVVGCASGLDAIELGLRAMGLRPGDRVLTTPLSAFATTLAVVRAGGVPVFVDVDASGLLDLDRVEACLASDRSIRYLLPVHLFGHAHDVERLGAIAARFEVGLYEDCCQAIGARSAGRPVGSVGRASSLSFYPTKNLGTLGDGGALLTPDAEIAAHTRALRDYGQTAKYEHTWLGLNSRLDELHAAVLSTAYLPRLTDWTERRRRVAAAYLEGITNRHVRPLPVPASSESVWHLFPVEVDPAARAPFMAHLREQGVLTGIHYPGIIPKQRALEGVAFEVVGPLDRAQALADGEVSLPIHPYLEHDEVERVVAAVNAFEPT